MNSSIMEGKLVNNIIMGVKLVNCRNYYNSQWDVSPLFIHVAVYSQLAAPSHLPPGGWQPTLWLPATGLGTSYPIFQQ
jgi:hypothetical protein